MRIAFISYEYPPETALGGIGTYVFNAARMLCARGHEVEVFCGSAAANRVLQDDGVCVHRLLSAQRASFPAVAGRAFATRHEERAFDVLEGPEFGAEAAGAAAAVPDIPLVVRLHTPSFLTRELNRARHTRAARLRALAADAWYRARRRWSDKDPERAHVLAADGVCSPSLALAALVAREWRLALAHIRHLPNPYMPPDELLALPLASAAPVVTFVGRLELRKGVLDLIRAVPAVLARMPKARFRFVGRCDLPSPAPGLDMQGFLREQLGAHAGQVEFCGQVAREELVTHLGASALCVFPSLWENFPYVCLEAMAAGRAIVASAAGGMAEILEDGRAGMLVAPRSPVALAEAIASVLGDPAAARSLGARARERVVAQYSAQRIGELQERFYLESIARRRGRGPRP